jgi:hypothetical protein
MEMGFQMRAPARLLAAFLVVSALTVPVVRPRAAEQPGSAPVVIAAPAAEVTPLTTGPIPGDAGSEIPASAGTDSLSRSPAVAFPLAHGPLSPMMAAIKAAWEENEAERARLTDAVNRAPNARDALRAQRELESALRGFELRLLRIQADFARLEGRTEQAKQIEAAIERIVNPPAPRRAVERPAPAGAR